MSLKLPYPHSVLSPNSPKRHWRAKQPAKGAARETAFVMALEQRGALDGVGELSLTLRIHPPTRARRDLDNVFSAMKSALDGVCAGIGVDDAQIRRVTLEWGAVVKGGEVELTLAAAQSLHHSL